MYTSTEQNEMPASLDAVLTEIEIFWDQVAPVDDPCEERFQCPVCRSWNDWIGCCSAECYSAWTYVDDTPQFAQEAEARALDEFERQLRADPFGNSYKEMQEIERNRHVTEPEQFGLF